MPKYMRRKKAKGPTKHKFRINKGKNYKYLNVEAVKEAIGNEDLKGSGLNHCNVCCRYFETKDILELHQKSKAHKQESKKQEWEAEQEAKDEQTRFKRVRRTSEPQLEVELKE